MKEYKCPTCDQPGADCGHWRCNVCAQPDPMCGQWNCCTDHEFVTGEQVHLQADEQSVNEYFAQLNARGDFYGWCETCGASLHPDGAGCPGH